MKRFLIRSISSKSGSLLRFSNTPVIVTKMIHHASAKGYVEDNNRRKPYSSNDRFYNYSGKLRLVTILFSKSPKELATYYNENKASFGQQDYLDLMVILFNKKVTKASNFSLEITNNMHKELRMYAKTNLDEILEREDGAFSLILYSSMFNPYFGKEMNDKILTKAVKDYEASSNSFNVTKKIMYLIGLNNLQGSVKRPNYSSIPNLKGVINDIDLKSKYLFAKYFAALERNENSEYFVNLLAQNLASMMDLNSFYQRIETISIISDIYEVYNLHSKDVEKGIVAQLTKIREFSEEYDSSSIIKTYRALNIFKSSNMKLPILNEMTKEIHEIVAFTLKHLTENIKPSFLFDFIDQLGKDLDLDDNISKEKEEITSQIITSLIAIDNDVLLKTSNYNRMLILKPIFTLKLKSDKVEKFLIKLIDSDFIKGIRVKDNLRQAKFAVTASEATSEKYKSALAEYIKKPLIGHGKGLATQIIKLFRIDYFRSFTNEINELIKKNLEEIKVKNLETSDRYWFAILDSESLIIKEIKDEISRTILYLAESQKSMSMQDYFYFHTIRTTLPETTKFLEELSKNEKFMLSLPFNFQSFLFNQRLLSNNEDHFTIRPILLDLLNFSKNIDKENINDPKYTQFILGLQKLLKLLVDSNSSSHGAYDPEVKILSLIFNNYLNESEAMKNISMFFVNDLIRDLSKTEHKYFFSFLVLRTLDNLVASENNFTTKNDLLKSIIYLQEHCDFKEPNLIKINTFLQEKLLSNLETHDDEEYDQKKILARQLMIFKIIDNIILNQSFYENNKAALEKYFSNILDYAMRSLKKERPLYGSVFDIINLLITCDSYFVIKNENFEKIKILLDEITQKPISFWISRIEVLSTFSQTKISNYLVKCIQSNYLQTKSTELSISNVFFFLKTISKLTLNSHFSKELNSKLSNDISENIEEIKLNKQNLKFIEVLSKCRIPNSFIYKKLIGDYFKNGRSQLLLLVNLYNIKKVDLFDFSILNQTVKVGKHYKLFQNASEKLIYALYLFEQPNPESNYLIIEKIMNSIQIHELFQIKNCNEYVASIIASGLLKHLKLKENVSLQYLILLKKLNSKMIDIYSKLCQEKERHLEIIKKIEDLNLGFTYVPDNQLIYSIVNEKEKIKIISINQFRFFKSSNTHINSILESHDPGYKYFFLQIQHLKGLLHKDVEFKEYIQKSFFKKEEEKREEEAK